MDYQGEFTGPQIDARLRLAGSAYQKPEGGIPETDLSEGVQEALQEAGTAYQKPENGIPATDLAEGVQESLQRGDSAYQKPVDGIPASDLAEGVQESLTRADTAYQKPASGIPKTDLAEGVQQSLDNGDNALSGVNGILQLIPSAASSLNKLADQALVQHLVQLMQASFCGNWDDWASVPSIAGDFPKIPDNNDYLVVLNASDYAPLYNGDATYSVGDIRTYNGTLYKALQDNFSGILPTDTNYWEAVDENPKYAGTWIFKYVPVDETYNKYNWFPEFKISDVPFTQEQMAAINSGINSLLVAKLINLPAKPVDTAAQTLSDAEKLQARTNIGATAPEVFWATYGTTTTSDIDAALAAGKIVIARNGNKYAFYIDRDTVTVKFMNVGSSGRLETWICRYSNNAWDVLVYNAQEKSNLVTSFGTTPSDSKYPSEKLVYDSMFVKGVISQTQTWASDYGSYTLSDVVRGDIPRSFIDMWNSRVLEFGTFNKTTGYFELNGLTDISYAEARDIVRMYEKGMSTDAWGPVQDDLKSFYTARTGIPTNPTTNGMPTITWNIYLEVTKFQYPDQYRYFNSLTSYGCYRLRRMIDKYQINSAVTLNSFYALEECYFSLTNDFTATASKYLSLASVVYMVENARNTGAVTYTLHSAAYARCQADTTEYEYSGQTYTGIIAYAAAKNISIVSA